MADSPEIIRRPFPVGFDRALKALLDDEGKKDQGDELMSLVWSELTLETLAQPFELSTFPSSFGSIAQFVTTEIQSQVEMIRSDLSDKVNRVFRKPKDNEKHLRFPKPYLKSPAKGEDVSIDFSLIHKVPDRGQFTNYVVVFQQLLPNGDPEMQSMKNLTLAFCSQLRKNGGAIFRLGSDAAILNDLKGHGDIYARVLLNFSMRKTHLRAISALYQSESELKGSAVASQVLRGHIKTTDMLTLNALDQWVSKSGKKMSIEIKKFNKQQQRALALEALTNEGLVLIQGPPGTGKSHCICHGLLPQLAGRKAKVLVLCNSNVAVDALMLKCTKIESLSGQILRCGFKQNVSDEIISMGLYAEGDLTAQADNYGQRAGSNSNTLDEDVQQQIRASRIVFTTIHFASKSKDKSENNSSYWNFDVLVLDECAQIEDSKILIVLARCTSLKKMVLVGDPKQLQPYVPNSLRQQGYGKSTMERLMDKADLEVSKEATARSGITPYIMLEKQFRMAPPLRQIVSNLYYGNRLQDAKEVLGRGPVAGIKLRSLLVVNLTGSPKRFSPLHQSYENEGEAMIVKLVYEFLLSSEFDGSLPKDTGEVEKKDICILTPYNRHKDRLRMLVCDIDEEQLDGYSGQTFSRVLSSPSKSQVLYGTQDEVGDDSAAMVANIDTVDTFQGSERTVVIVSTCVDEKPLRAADPHFINVACSRAQHLLVVVGNFSHGLMASDDWKFVQSQAKAHGSYMEHAVEYTPPEPGADEDDEGILEVYEADFKAKLQALLEPPSKKAKV